MTSLAAKIKECGLRIWVDRSRVKYCATRRPDQTTLAFLRRHKAEIIQAFRTNPCAFCPHDPTCQVRPGSESFRRFVRNLKKATKGHRVELDEDYYVVDGDRLPLPPCLRPVIEEGIETQDERNRAFQRENDYLVRRFCRRCKYSRKEKGLVLCLNPPLEDERRVGLPISSIMHCPEKKWQRKVYPPCEGCGRYRAGSCVEKSCGWAILTGPDGREDFR